MHGFRLIDALTARRTARLVAISRILVFSSDSVGVDPLIGSITTKSAS